MAVRHVLDLVPFGHVAKGGEVCTVYGIARHDPVRLSLDAEVIQVSDHT